MTPRPPVTHLRAPYNNAMPLCGCKTDHVSVKLSGKDALKECNCIPCLRIAAERGAKMQRGIEGLLYTIERGDADSMTVERELRALGDLC